MEPANPRPKFLRDPTGWHWSLMWWTPTKRAFHRVESNTVFASEAEARADFKEREQEVRCDTDLEDYN